MSFDAVGVVSKVFQFVCAAARINSEARGVNVEAGCVDAVAVCVDAEAYAWTLRGWRGGWALFPWGSMWWRRRCLCGSARA